ncbi:TIGR02996 domain-containing protein [Frigoriglobus tundricola]|uniref:TIGR02996 domain-containing protein n=1 Tax=Frigoriglobus tundricola TaxID=2774151 RepID=A0A6M5YY35_9BACT|nr:TIGR02996 domain-containing protein [Frigoriglobus tundricola]QJW98929.1 hypothetical protein FTUN_6524 [Frigoriglobus tundricola]
MSTEAALLRAIRNAPAEDTPRLMYADYLDEEGCSARAEFIRVQVARAQLPEHDPRRGPLEDRAHELLAEHECDWLGVPADARDELTEWEFDRGFVNEVAASPVFMRDSGAELCAAHPVRRWRVMSGDRSTNFPEDLRETGQRGWFGRLEAVDLSGWYADLGEISSFLARSNFERLSELDLTGRGPLDPLPEILEFAPFRDRLKVLRCGAGGYANGRLDARELVQSLGPACRLDELAVPAALLMADDLRELLAADALARLTALDLRDNEIAPDGWHAFRSARFRLRELDISGTPLGGFALEDLLGCAALSELRRLHLNRCGSAMANIRALAGSRFWAQAEELRIHDGSIPETSLDPLFAAPGPSGLRVLDVSDNWVRDGGVAQLCGAAWAGALSYLDLSRNYLSDAALATIAGSGRFKNLHTLHLNFNSPYHLDAAEPHEAVTDIGLRALANSPDLANLRVLSVSGTRITHAGVEAVLNAPHWRLTGLQLSQCQLRSAALDALAASPRLSRLEVLVVSS